MACTVDQPNVQDMSQVSECVICFDEITCGASNTVVTECGHKFHTNCLMKSVAFNGYGCPYCRTKMAEEPDSDDDSDEDYEEEEDNRNRTLRFIVDDDDEDGDDPRDLSLYRETFYEAKGNNFSDYALTSYRMLFQRANDLLLEEDTFDLSDAYLDDLSEKLEKRGINKNYIIRCVLSQHENFSKKLRIFEYRDHFDDLIDTLTEPLN